MGAIILGKELSEKLISASTKAEEFPHDFTVGGNPLGNAIAMKSLEVLKDEGLLESVNKLSPKFMARLNKIGQHKYAGEARGVGLMGAVELIADKETKEPLPSELQVFERMSNKAQEKGLICRPLGAAIALGSPFIMTEDELDEIFDILEDTIEEDFIDVGL